MFVKQYLCLDFLKIIVTDYCSVTSNIDTRLFVA